MLADLCFYFPELRQVFDYVERIALRAGDKIIPSRAVFPLESGSQASSQAMLATMDSAVVTLLLAEWAIYLLLKELGVTADILLGCSTGEFAALTISDAVNILESAETFYGLSTHVARSVSFSLLSELRTVRVTASYEKIIKPLLAKLSQTVYVGADLSESCVLLSGQKTAIEELCKLMRESNVDYLMLPVAIPYHTPLVSGKISNEDTRSLKMGAPQVEAWSCSTEERYPDDAEDLRKITTGLFEKTIKLRSTIERLYEAEARIFVEVGPKGGLVPYIAEVLAEKRHLALATNLAGKSGVDQLNALLAVLACHGVEMDLEALYHRRVAAERFSQQQARSDQPSQHSPDFTFENSADAQGSSVDFELSSLNSSNLFRDFFNSSQGMSNTDDMINNLLESGVDLFSGGMLSDEVMITYLSTMQQFHESMMGTHERLLLSYLSGAESNPEISLEEDYHSAGFAFLPNAAVQANQDCFTLSFSLSTVRQPFLLDHAIGGNVKSQTAPSRVCLLPLMVALEIMAEGASLLCGDLQVARLSDIRAYKRIRTDKRDLPLVLELREAKNGGIEARICHDVPPGEEAEVYASCVVEFEHVLPEAPPPAIFPVQEEKSSRLSPAHLYGPGSMFHGPAMQSVESIDLVARRSIEGRINCRHADKWFQDQAPEVAPHMVLDPLLLDNASQFVLYQMYEHDLPATALLPFHVGSIEFFQGYHSLRGETVFASAHLRSMSQRGTEAQIQLVDPAGYTVARVNDISSRAIILPDVFRDFIADPSRLICKRVNFTALGDAAISTLERSEMPQDETALDWLTDYILTDNEQQEWRQLAKTEKRRLDWLMGRIAAKDAVRLLAKQAFGLTLKCADIQISKTEIGNVEARVFNFQLPWTPQISISHCQTTAVALAEPPRANHQAGIDVEEIKERDEGFAEFSFTKSELQWLSTKPSAEKALHIAKLWTAKEAAAKASCSGFSGNPKLFELQSANSTDDSFQIKARIDDTKRAGIYTCHVTSSDKLSLAVVLAFAP